MLTTFWRKTNDKNFISHAMLRQVKEPPVIFIVYLVGKGIVSVLSTGTTLFLFLFSLFSFLQREKVTRKTTPSPDVSAIIKEDKLKIAVEKRDGPVR